MFTANRTAKPTPWQTKRSMKQKEKLLARHLQRKPKRPAPKPNWPVPKPSREKLRRDSEVEFFICWKMWSCPTAWSSMFRSTCAQSLDDYLSAGHAFAAAEII